MSEFYYTKKDKKYYICHPNIDAEFYYDEKEWGMSIKKVIDQLNKGEAIFKIVQ